MLQAGIASIMIFFNFILYFVFGSLLAPVSGKKEFSVTRTVFAGFFLYYTVFTAFCIPAMLKWKPLSYLAGIWAAVMVAAFAAAAALAFRKWKAAVRRIRKYDPGHWGFLAGVFILSAVQAFIIIYNYQFTLDAAYYVANVATSLQTDSMNIYDPYTGNWQDHFQMRYFFSDFSINDAVLCSLFRIPPLVWCKTTMAGTAVFLTNMVSYMIGNKLFGGERKKVFLFLLFTEIMNFFFITIYTTSEFLVVRTCEGKCLLANVVLPGILYLYLDLTENTRDRNSWLLLLLVCLGSSALSSSSNMLIPASIGVTILPLAVVKKDWRVVPKAIGCMVPCVLLMLAYVAYVKGLYVIYTYPR